ncbi:MAG: indolepyruvate oxidoreductase subunit beta [Syntrophobacterales bacterium]|nr:indolepyruvate oxidoreductase subunit beta [Syntrophobacterales bacterium]
MPKDNTTKSILLAGVGGQGILRASDIISLALMAAGYDVKKSEVHGMAQRGGSVTSHVRYGKKVYSPLAARGSVDIMLSFEKLETLRYIDYLKKNASVLINDEAIFPPAVNMGTAVYPENIPEIVGKAFKKVKVVQAVVLAEQAGEARTANTVMIGAISNFLDVLLEVWEEVIGKSFPERLVEVNIEAFKLGRNA